MTALCAFLTLLGMSAWRIVSLTQARTVTAHASVSERTSPTPGANWQQEMTLLGLATTSDPNAASAGDPIALIGPSVIGQLIGTFAGLAGSGTYSSEAFAKAAESIAPNVKAILNYKTYGVIDIKTDNDTSFDRMLTYRADLREALAPLLENTENELDIYARYIETSDTDNLARLQHASVHYHKAVENLALMTVPKDAVNYHVAILNATQEFGATLDAIATHPDDPFAIAALLRSYNKAEADMYTSYDGLASYYGQKRP